MNPGSCEKLKVIHFAGQMLPHWAQLLDLAATLSAVPEETRAWFSRFTHSPGVDDSRTILEQCNLLRSRLVKSKGSVSSALQRSRNDAQAAQILGAWNYALETMIQEARTAKTCSWIIEGHEETDGADSSGGDVTLRRV